MVADLLLAVAVLHDVRTEKRVHPAYFLALAVFALVNVGVFWAFGSPVWMAVAKALTA
jgi:nitrate reductase NapE component